MDELKFKITEVKQYDKGAYSLYRYLNRAIAYNENKVIAVSEAIQFEPDSDHKGGMIIFSTEVNAENMMSNNRLVNFLKQKFASFRDRLYNYKKIDNIANNYNLVGWTVGKFLSSKYTTKNGRIYNEDSLSVEIIGIDTDELNNIAEDLCIEFLQESVLIKNYNRNRICFIDAE